MNDTERRQLYRVAGLPLPPRTLSSDELDILSLPLKTSNQQLIRAKVETFVQRHWDVLSETLSCSGDCAQPQNPCTDAQAAVCYLTNKAEVD